MTKLQLIKLAWRKKRDIFDDILPLIVSGQITSIPQVLNF
jgi:hypothetical protein